MKGRFETARVLVEAGAPLEARRGDGTTPLHWAAGEGDVALTNLLLQAGADPNAAARFAGDTPLHAADANPELVFCPVSNFTWASALW